MPRIRTLLIPAAAIAAVAAIAGAGATGRPEAGPAPGQAIPVLLSEARGVAVYTVERDGGFRVVATITAGEEAMPVRATAMLRPGQSMTLSVPGSAGTTPAEVTFQRRGERLVVSEPPREAAALR
ncbi:MAG TPA: hypothetical protein VE033_19745 [Acetobacteraceae bacterium]|jgi:hypothetical protein|nr:hypothetical protein [Acetobacteraceae bacterium]